MSARDPLCPERISSKPDQCRCALIARVRADERAKWAALVADGIEAFRLTKEYVNIPDENGFVLLPDVEGWSHFDWTERARTMLGGEDS